LQSSHDNYLETEVMTASPQKLQFMLLDAAVRSLQRGKHLWSAGQDDVACEALIRAQEIVTQILTGLNREVDANLTSKVASIYLFVFRTINDAMLQRSEEKIDECIGVLEVERETWRLLCEQIDAGQPTDNGAARATLSAQAGSPAAPPAAPTMPPVDLPGESLSGDGLSSGFSIEA